MALTMRSCSCGTGKEVCLVMARDFMGLLIKMQAGSAWSNLKNAETFSCSGCTCLIKFTECYQNDTTDIEAENAIPRLLKVMEELNGRPVDCPFLEALKADGIDNILEDFVPMAVPAQTVLLKENRPSLKLYLILPGRFALKRNKEVVSKEK